MRTKRPRLTPDRDVSSAARRSKTGGRSSRRSGSERFRLSLIGGLAAIVCVVGLVLGVLARSEVHAHERTRQASSVADSIRTVDALKWRAVAGQDIDKITDLFEPAAAELHVEAGRLGDSELERNFHFEMHSYLTAVGDFLAANDSGDHALADEIDETRVGPQYETVFADIKEIVARETTSSENYERIAMTLTSTSLLAMAVTAAGLVYFVLASRDRRRDKRISRNTEQRFSSLVEGAKDVITVVAGDLDLSILSPNLGVLERLTLGPRPTRLSDVLPPDALSQWRTIDERLAVDAGHHLVELTLEDRDGETLHIEGHGSLLVSDLTQRVWVWRDVTTRRELELQLSYQAFHDSLTGAPNRSLLVDRIDNALSIATEADGPITVLFCDLDDFKHVNDAVGHDHGDELLKIIAQRLEGCMRKHDTFARLGSDEFAILLEDSHVDAAPALARRIISVVSHEVELADRKIFPSISIGIATAVDGASAVELLGNAEMAMYWAKRSGKGQAVHFQDQMRDATNHDVELQADLPGALADGQFRLHYQPTVNLGDGTVEGFEALIRWQHPTKGEVPPDEFIHLAESSGIIVDIGRWVIREACRAGIELQGRFDSPLWMAANLSPQQLRDPTIVDVVKQALADSGLAPERLVLEVTEGCLLDDETAVGRLRDLRALGVLIAIDDFGTGYTSLNYLQSLPVSILKIDRSFVSGDVLDVNERTAFLQAIVGLAKSLNLRSVAEGIEDLDQLDDLTRFGCDTGQGFYWSPAVPLSSAPAAVANIQEELLRRMTDEFETVGLQR